MLINNIRAQESQESARIHENNEQRAIATARQLNAINSASEERRREEFAYECS
jgi:hypothetical protein